MDWDRLENLLSHDTQKLVSVDSTLFLLDFFETLFKALKDCPSVGQCSSLYPRAGRLLTTLATHPYIGCNGKLVSLVIDCIIEYTKYSFDPQAAVSHFIPKSSTWCLQRLRRLSYGSTTFETHLLPSALERKINKVTSSIQEHSKKGNLTIAKMDQLCDMTLLLLRDDTAFKVVEALMDAALELEQQQRNERKKHDIVRWNDNDSTFCTCILSDRFTKYVLDSIDDENGLYQQQWSVKLKTKAWQTIPDLFECEWVDWMSKELDSEQGNASIGRQGWSSAVANVQHPLLQGLQQCPRLIYVSFTLISRWIFDTDLADWRIVRLWIKVVDWCLLQQEMIGDPQETIQLWGFPGNLTNLLELMVNTSPLSLSTSCHVDRIYSGLISFIYEGSPLTLNERRNEAWLLSVMCPFYNFWCVGLWISWCTEDENRWSGKMDQLSRYIAWLVCPSLDNRMDSYYYGLKRWIQSSKGFDRQDPTDGKFIDDWYVLFNGQVQVGVDVLVSMIQYSQSWTIHQCISMINRFLDRTNTRGVSTKTRCDDDSVTMSLVERLADLDDSRRNSLISYVYSILP